MTQRLRLNKNADRRLKAGHLWIYSNEVDIKETPLKNFAAGETALVEASNGKVMAVAYVNPHSLIAARIMSRDSETVPYNNLTMPTTDPVYNSVAAR